ncbi:hypothetical protein AXF42_Ash006646 [Apostasia shenzhenica]|uniref:Uncharacterized protein n=1 Tax=Apostasia shenzhenica TaxID=1088818 RepID=A0A2I0AIQ0_9ASPA|nr:hypothetical protein AXF42_Ash006646 [Apostasia shenzhenica]
MADSILPPPPHPLPPSRHRNLGLLKQRSWSPDTERDESWERRKDLHRARRGSRGARSVTDDDFDELRACIDLGIVFGDGSPDGGDCPKRLSEILPALELYFAVHRGFQGSAAAGLSSASESSSAGGSPAGSPLSIFSLGGSPAERKASLKQWAQVVACSVRQHYGPV